MRLFGTDGIRGVANRELTPELALSLGKSFGRLLLSEEGKARVIIARDTRISSPMLEAAFAAGLASAGSWAVILGVLPTPAVPFFIKHYSAQGGAMISASHNPIEDNGIKLFSARGFKLPDETEDRIQQLMEEPLPKEQMPIGSHLGRIAWIDNALELYLQHLRELFPLNLNGWKIGLDCANGAACHLAPRLFESLGAEVFAVHTQDDGLRINVKCGSTYLTDLINLVQEKKLDLGLAFDGDADRCIAVDSRGGIFEGDRFLALFAQYLAEKGLLSGEGVAGTILSNLGLEVFLKQLELKLYRAKVGDRYVLETMQQNRLNLGGEQSGHIILLDYDTTGNGILTGLFLLKILTEKREALSSFTGIIKPFPQITYDLQVQDNNSFLQDPVIKQELEKAEISLKDKGRLVVRPSGTQPLIRFMLEGSDAALLDSTLNHLKQVFISRLGEKVVKR